MLGVQNRSNGTAFGGLLCSRVYVEADFQWGSSHASMDQGSCLLAFPGDVDFAKGQHPEA